MTTPLNEQTGAQIILRLDRIETVLNGDGTVGGKEGVVNAINQMKRQMDELAEVRNAPWRIMYSTISHVITAVITALVIAALINPSRAAGVPKPIPGGVQHGR